MGKKSTSSKSETDWKWIDAMADEEIDLSDCPEITPEMFAKAIVREGLASNKKNTQVTNFLTLFFRAKRRSLL